MEPSDAAERARGMMVGIAAGNLLGIVQEGWSRQSVAETFPDGVREIAAVAGYPDDDDLAQAIVIAEAAEHGPLNPEDVGRRLWEWAETNGLGMGGLTGHVLELYGGDVPQFLGARGRTGPSREPAGMPITEASRVAWDGSRAGNGAAMRCAPIAIRWRDDPTALVRNSVVSAVPTHWDKRCGWSCALLNVAAAAALRGESIAPDELLTASLHGVRASLSDLARYDYEAGVPASVREAVLKASDAEIADLRLDGDSMGFTLLALQVGLIALWRAASFDEALSDIVEAGGDTDTNGAVAGAMLGARFGLEAIPQRWRDRIAEIRAGGTPMESLADRLLAANDAAGRPGNGSPSPQPRYCQVSVAQDEPTTGRPERKPQRGACSAAPDAKPQTQGNATLDAATWKHALDEYRYPVDLRRFPEAPQHPGWFQLNICPGDPLQTTGFETRFRSQARHHVQAWAEVVFWKLDSGRRGFAARQARRLLDADRPVSASELWSSCMAYVEQPGQTTFSAFREKLFTTGAVATAATFPAFICPEKFPMVDTQIARWVRENGDRHGYPGDLSQVPTVTITERHWSFVDSWMKWCRTMAAELSRRTGLFWRARDVEMAVFTTQRCGLELDPLM